MHKTWRAGAGKSLSEALPFGRFPISLFFASLFFVAVLILASCASEKEAPVEEPDPVSPRTFINNVTLIDGTGAPARVANVQIRDGVIEAIDGPTINITSGDNIVMASPEHILAPGFIDAHSHHDWGLAGEPSADAAVSQGITTIVVGQDGGSNYPLSAWFFELEKNPVAVNVASYSGHNTHRAAVLGDDFRRTATRDEIEVMKERVVLDMEAGALGLSTGLEYDPGIYSNTDEVLELAQVASRFGGRYISHIRSEDRYFWKAIDEILEIGSSAELPVQISHIKLAMQSSIGKADELIERLETARAAGVDVTADIYPYDFWQSTLEVMFPERDFDNIESARFAVNELSTPEGIVIPDYLPDPSYEGKTLAQIADLRKEEPAVTLMALIEKAQEYAAAMRAAGEKPGDVENVLAVSMAEEDIERLMQWPHTVFCSDGGLRGAHPRGFGAFPRILGRYVRERETLSFEEAIHKATQQAAEQLGLEGRGVVEVGAPADLILFHRERVMDTATIEEPHAVAKGIRKVWVNGEVVWEEGKPVEARPGKVLRR